MQKGLIVWISDLLASGNAAKVSSQKVKERFDREDSTVCGLQIPKWFPDYLYVHDLICEVLANMLSEVPNKLNDHTGRFECVEGDFFAETFDLEHNRFDCVVSVHEIHHGRHPDAYRNVYHKIYKWLKPGGCFACLDNVAGDTLELATLSYVGWAESFRSEYDSESICWIVETTIREDSPRSLREHLEILGEC